MSISKLVRSAFLAQDRARGHSYYLGGRVSDLQINPAEISAVVRGSRRGGYEVSIDLSEAKQGLVAGHCTCPRFQDGSLCKHLWAVVLAADAAGTKVTVETRHGKKKPKPTPAPAWKRQLRTVTRTANDLTAHDFDPWDKAAAETREIWYVINIGSSQATGELIIELFSRQPKRDGELGKPRRLSLNSREVQRMARTDDQAALALLLRSDSNFDAGYGYGGYSSSSISPDAELMKVALERVAATGRLVWILEEGDAIEAERRLTWDNGPPWKFRLVVEDQPEKKSWVCRGELHRPSGDGPGNDSNRVPGISLDQPMLVLAGGLVVWPDCVARLDAQHFAWMQVLRKEQGLIIPYEGRVALIKSIWDTPGQIDCKLPEALQPTTVTVPPQGRLQVRKSQDNYYSRNRDLLTADVAFLYGDETVPVGTAATAIVRGDGKQIVVRDPAAESALLARLKALQLRGNNEYGLSPNQARVPQRRLEEIVETLTHEGWLVEAEGLRLRKAGHWTMSVVSGVDWFDLEGKLDFDGQSVAMPELLAAVRRGDTYVKLGDGSRGMLPKEWLSRYGSLAAMGEAKGDAVRFTSCQALMLDAMLAEQEAKVDRPFKQLRDKLRTFAGIAPLQEPDGFGGELRHYQREGLGWLEFLRDFRFGGCLADDMGLGKTIQVLALLERRRKRRVTKDAERAPSLVVVPKSLIFNWIDEAARFTPNLKVLNYTGLTRRQNGKPSEHDVVITTYGTLRKDIAELRKIRFDYAILDESQAIKNAGSQSAKACRLIAAEHRLAMTGTPVENHLGELWSLFEFLNPGMLGFSNAFQAATKGNGEDGAAALKPLATALAPFILRRTKEQVLTELPAKTEQTLYCEMDKAQRRQYEELRDYYRASLANRIKEVGLKRAKIHVLESLLRLRQVACHPGLVDPKKIDEPSAKLDALLEQLDEILSEGHKALIFSQFTSLLAIVRQRLDKRKIAYEYLDGKTSDRKARVERFQNDAKCPLFLISLKAGGHGLNLTAADYVYILDPWWNPAVEAQALDRAHRMGQTRPVFAYRLICRDTVEEKILELQKHKRQLADAILTADGSLLRNLTADDLQLLLS